MSTRDTSNDAIAEAAARWIARRDAGMTESEHRDFDRWCAEDRRHIAAVKHFASAWSVLDRTGRRQTGDAILHELGRRQRRRRHVVALAVCALLVAGSVLFRENRSARPTDSVAVRAGGVLRAPETRTLPDGSTVELKPGAEIAVHFAPALRRIVLLQGEAHFQVLNDPARPFAVDAGAVHVRAVGTAFSVHREARQIDVVVTEGRIAVERPASESVITNSGNAPLPSAASVETIATAGAGERVVWQATLDASPAKAEVFAISSTDLADRLAWREPRIEFSDTPLAEAVAMMNQAGRAPGALPVVIDPSAVALAREPISGLFRPDNTDAFVRVLELSLPVHAERRDGRIVLRTRP